jgi:tellurite resistance protein TehA-like permease
MNVVDLLITIVVVTILVTIVLAVATYVAYKLRMAREPETQRAPTSTKYFVLHAPEAVGADEMIAGSGGEAHASTS